MAERTPGPLTVVVDQRADSRDHDPAAHWDEVFRTRQTDQVSWYQPHATTSLRLLQDASGSVVDVGAGASTLVDDLLEVGRDDVTVLDISGAALALTRSRLGQRARGVRFVRTDLLAWEPGRTYDVWHDRAVFHFLTDRGDQGRYADLVARAVAPGGTVVLGSFGPDGPTQCSGLPTARHSPADLTELFSPGFAMVHSETESHHTPGGHDQSFVWVVLRRQGSR